MKTTRFSAVQGPNVKPVSTWTYDLDIDSNLKAQIKEFKIGDQVAITKIEGDYIYDNPHIISGETDSAWILKLNGKERAFKKAEYKLELIKR